MARFLAEVNSTSVRDLIGAADFNGDSKADYALFDASTLSTATWHLSNNVYVSGLFGPTVPAGWSLVAPATVAPTATPTATLTPRPTPTPRFQPTPRPHATPPPRP